MHNIKSVTGAYLASMLISLIEYSTWKHTPEKEKEINTLQENFFKQKN